MGWPEQQKRKSEIVMYRILVVEDDKTISRIICAELQKEGFDTEMVTEFDNIAEKYLAYQPHLAIMDINLPGTSGFYWCKEIRVLSEAPLIFISARDSDRDIVKAMTLGGDDYLVKPFSAEVLIAKVKSMLRRTYSYREEENSIVSYGDLILNLDNGVVMHKEKEAQLTYNEMSILGMLLKSGGKAVSRERIMRSLWKDEKFIDDNTLTVNITRIRRKLDSIGCENRIQTIRNEGYMI